MKDKIYVVVMKDDVSSEDDIFITQAKDKEKALYNYARDSYSKEESFKEMVEDRAINGGYWDEFFENIFGFSIEEGYKTNLTDEEIEVKLKRNIKEYLGDHHKYTDTLLDFYNDESKTLVFCQ